MMSDVIHDIRSMFDAEHCCIPLIDSFEKKCTVRCEALVEKIGDII